MGRLEGFLFFYPGWPALTVPYHDTNDFFYSGHVGTCFLIALEYRAGKWYKMWWFIVFVMINQWIMMTLVRTHYVIDLWTGMFVSHYFFIMAEKVSFITDVKGLGIPAKKRKRNFFKPCKCCGWSNKHAGDFIRNAEKQRLKGLYKEHMRLL